MKKKVYILLNCTSLFLPVVGQLRFNLQTKKKRQAPIIVKKGIVYYLVDNLRI